MSKNVKYHPVTFLPEQKTIQVEHLKTIFETILEHNPQNIELRFACGAEGICQKCKVRALQEMGPVTPTERGCLSEDELQKGIRLACQARVIQETQAEIIYKMPFSIELLDEAVTPEVDLSPRVEKVHVRAQADGGVTASALVEAVTSGGAYGGDAEKLREALDQKFSSFFYAPGSGCTAVFIEDTLICLEEGDSTDSKFAAAVDVGINTLMVSLVDLNTGRKVAVVTDTNPQMELGADLESRISMVAEDEMNLEILGEEILLRIDLLILEMCRARGVPPTHVYEIALSGTTGMMHLFLKGVPGLLEQQSLFGEDPSGAFRAGQLELRAPERARVHSLPVISSYVGADITAGILATRLHHRRETVLLLDLGTTLKAVLHHGGTIVATSALQGGAFEGAGIGFGMRPENGAIESVRIEADLHLDVVGESLPRGICGSGLIELAAALKRLGIVDAQGDFQTSASPPPAVAERVIEAEGQPAFLLYSDVGAFETDIYVTARDIHCLREARARMVAMIGRLFEETGIGAGEVEHVFIGGAFGRRIDAEAFFELGMLPDELRGRVSFVGNTAKQGAQMVLLDRAVLAEAEKIARQVRCIPPGEEPLSRCLLTFDFFQK